MAVAESLLGASQAASSQELAQSWRRLTRAATVVAVLTSPALFVWFTQQNPRTRGSGPGRHRAFRVRSSGRRGRLRCRSRSAPHSIEASPRRAPSPRRARGGGRPPEAAASRDHYPSRRTPVGEARVEPDGGPAPPRRHEQLSAGLLQCASWSSSRHSGRSPALRPSTGGRGCRPPGRCRPLG